MSLLRDIDEKYLPAVAAWVDRLAKKFPKGPEPTGPLPVIVRLRRVDDRWTGAGPFALLREVPQFGGMALALLIMVNGAVVFQRVDRTPAPVEQVIESEGPEDPAEDDHLGPRLGEKVPAYVTATRQRLLRLGGGQPDGMAVAVVHFTRYQTPEEARRLLGSLEAHRIFYRAPLKLPHGEKRSRTVKDLVQDSKGHFRRHAQVHLAEAGRLRRESATIENDPAQVESNLADAVVHEREAKILRGPCKCVYAVVVRAQYRALTELVAQSGIRAVDAGGPGSDVGDFEYTGLLPEETTTVTGGNQE